MIPLVDLTAQYHSIKEEIDAAVNATLESGHFILGPAVSKFEESVASYLGADHAIGLASGTDALVLALRALDIGTGDEVIIPAYTFFATAGTVMSVGAKPVFVDIDQVSYEIDVAQIKDCITARTKAIIPVHLYGHPADMDPILELARSHGLKVIEDNAQAFGATCRGKKTGSIGDIGCLSFFPTKNLGAFGDGGMVVTNDSQLAERMRMLRTHGWRKKYYSEEVGYNSRLDALQAAILQAKLPHVDSWNERRREIAKRYSEQLAPLGITVPVECDWARHVYHLYIIRSGRRDELQAFLKQSGIASEVYYPLPPHLSTPCRKFGYKEGDYPHAELASRETLALPLYAELTLAQQDEVIAGVGQYMKV
jgi:dTDP-4-amino-4,6-dideoxygalactose transaminase